MWKTIEDSNLKSIYEINEYGDIRNIKTARKRKSHIDKDGYKNIILYDINGNRKNFKVHRLVAKTFIGIDNSDELIINHKDGIRTNNHVENLEWTTPKGNSMHMITKGKFYKDNKKKYDLVERLCAYLAKGLSTSDIMKKEKIYGGKKNKKYVKVVKMIYAIRHNKSFKNISSKYNIKDEGSTTIPSVPFIELDHDITVTTGVRLK